MKEATEGKATMRTAVLILMALVYAYPALAEDTQIYACQDQAATGFNINDKTHAIISQSFAPAKEIFKYSQPVSSIKIQLKDSKVLDFDLVCFNTDVNAYSCSNRILLFNLNFENLKFTLAFAGYISNNPKSFASPYVAYGICTKF